MRKELEFRIQDILPIGFTLVVAGIGLAYGIEVTGDVQDGFCSDNLVGDECRICPSAYPTYNTTGESCYNATFSNVAYTSNTNVQWNASGSMMTGVSNITSKFPTLGTILVASIIIGILVTYLFMRTWERKENPWEERKLLKEKLKEKLNEKRKNDKVV